MTAAKAAEGTTGDEPNGNIMLWMVPTMAFQLALYTWQTVNGFLTPTDPIVVPPAYLEALEYTPAERIAGF